MTTTDAIGTMDTVRAPGGLCPAAREARATQTLPRIVVAHGEGIGAEITPAVIEILVAAGARIDVVPIEIGEKAYRQGVNSGISADAWRVIRESGVMTGSVSLVGTANVGDHGALFVAIHGSAPDIAGLDEANPLGLLLAGVMMLHYLGQSEAADRAQQAWLATIEEGLHRADIADSETSTVIGTHAFTLEIVKRLGTWPKDIVSTQLVLPSVRPWSRSPMVLPAHKDMVGVDVFVQWGGRDPQVLADLLRSAGTNGLVLEMITNRGFKVWPEGLQETFCVDHWRCRFVPDGRGTINHAQILGLLHNLAGADIELIKTEHLCTFDDEAGFSYGRSQ